MATTNNPVIDPASRLAALATRLREPFDCPSCDGTGEVEDEGWEPSFRGDTRSYLSGIIDCGACGGDGTLYVDLPRDVALALADLVDAAVNDHAAIYEADCYCRDGATCGNLDALLPLADLILGADT